jgi:hypothetical protein
MRAFGSVHAICRVGVFQANPASSGRCTVAVEKISRGAGQMMMLWRLLIVVLVVLNVLARLDDRMQREKDDRENYAPF